MPAKNYKTLYQYIWALIKTDKLYLVGFTLVAMFWAFEMAITPFLLKLIINTVSKYSSNPALMIRHIVWLAVCYCLITLVLNVAFRLREYISLKLYPKLKSLIINSVFSSLFRMPLTYFKSNPTGSIAKKIFDLASNVEAILRISNEWFYSRILALLIASVVLFLSVNSLYVIILDAWSFFYFLLSYKLSAKSFKLSKEFSNSLITTDGFVVDSISNIINAKIFASKGSELSKLNAHLSNLINNDTNLQKQNMRVFFFQSLTVTALLSAMLSALIYQRFHGNVSVGDFALVLSLSISFVIAVYDAGMQILRASKAFGACQPGINLLNEIANFPVDDQTTIKVNSADLEFRNLSFSYSKNKIILDDINLFIKSGEKVAIIGESGVGKTSIFSLLLRLLEPTSGCILLDGKNIKDYSVESLCHEISTIPQEPNLYNRSIMENIRIADPRATDEEIRSACILSAADGFIQDLDDGYDTLVGNKGENLSGGQKQRISIARAILKNTNLILMDEPTTGLDLATGNEIGQHFNAIFERKTVIVIAHSLSTLNNMDRVLLLKDSKIIELGEGKNILKSTYFKNLKTYE